QPALGGGPRAKFRGGGLAEQNPARVAHPYDDLFVDRRKVVLVVAGAHSRSNVFGPVQILNRVRDAEHETTSAFPVAQLFYSIGIRECALWGKRHVCAELWVKLLGASDEKLGDLARSHLFLEHQLAHFPGLYVWIEHSRASSARLPMWPAQALG